MAPHPQGRWGVLLLVSVAVGALAAAVAYVAAFAALVPRPDVPTFKELLLRDAPGPRLIVDSGSSAVQGLNPTTLGTAMNRVGFLASDSGNFSPVHKAWRLLRYARPGDLVVLPLEWLHYDDPSRLDASYLEAAVTVLPAYFRALPWSEGVRFMASLPLGKALAIAWANARARWAGDATAGTIPGLHVLLAEGWDGRGPTAEAKLLPEAQSTTCAAYVFRPDQLQRRPDATRLAPLAGPLQQLQAWGVPVVVIPPIVAGDGCYAEKEAVAAYWQSVQAALRPAGILVLGTPEQLWFGPEHLTNTYYHVNEPARAIATQRVANWLREAGLALPNPPQESLAATLLALEGRLAKKQAWPDAALPLDHAVAPDGPGLLPVAGWWAAEPGHRWTRGTEAALRARLPPGTKALTFDLKSFQDQREVEVSVAGRIARATVSPGGGTVTVEVPLGLVEAEIRFRTVSRPATARPVDVGLNGDRRSLGLDLWSVRALPR